MALAWTAGSAQQVSVVSAHVRWAAGAACMSESDALMQFTVDRALLSAADLQRKGAEPRVGSSWMLCGVVAWEEGGAWEAWGCQARRIASIVGVEGSV